MTRRSLADNNWIMGGAAVLILTILAVIMFQAGQVEIELGGLQLSMDSTDEGRIALSFLNSV